MPPSETDLEQGALETRTFEYSARHVNHRVITGGIVALVGLVIMFTVAGDSLLFQLLLAVAIAGVAYHAFRTHRLQQAGDVGVRVGPDGLRVAAWGWGEVPWSEIEAVRIAGRTMVVITPKDLPLWLRRLKPVGRALRRVSALVGSDPFTIDAGLLKGQPVELETAIRHWLVKSNA